MKAKISFAGRLCLPEFGLLLILALLAACVPERPAPSRQNVFRSIPDSGSSNTGTIPPALEGEAAVSVADQEFDGQSVVVPRVVSPGPGWMAIHKEENGDVGPVIGFAPLDSGVNLNVLVQIDGAQATPVLYAMLHSDAGEIGKYEFPGPDGPVFVNGVMIIASFQASGGQTLPPGITAVDPAVSAGTVRLDQVVSAGPGWVAILAVQTDGQPGEIIGYTHVANGMNSGVIITVDSAKVTPLLFATLFADAGEIGAFENPAPDAPVEENGQAVSLSFHSTPGAASGAAAAGTGTPETSARATLRVPRPLLLERPPLQRPGRKQPPAPRPAARNHPRPPPPSSLWSRYPTRCCPAGR